VDPTEQADVGDHILKIYIKTHEGKDKDGVDFPGGANATF